MTVTTAEPSGIGAACPACAAAPLARQIAEANVKPGDILLSLPTIHCAACISGVERALAATPGVMHARVNLTQKRATISAEPSVTPADLTDALARAGYEAHELDAAALTATQADSTGRDLLMRLGVSGFAMMNVMLLSVAVWSGAEAATRDLFHWISAAIALPTIAFAARPFFVSAWSALRLRRLNMDVPISLAILLAPAMSLYETAQSGPHAYFDAAISLTFFLLAGRYLDHRTRAVARSAAEELAALEVPRAIRLTGGVEVTVPADDLLVGDLVIVRPGARMPVDGTVTSGRSELDCALLTGESLPVAVGPGDDVCAGQVNLTGPLTVRVSAAGAETSLHRMADLVAVAERAKSGYTSLADKAAAIYAPGVHLISAAAFLAWLWISAGDVRLSLNIAIAVLIITCPCALGLAVPAVMTAATGALFRRNLLVKDGTAIERLAQVDTVVFDKTGTLTKGSPQLDGFGTTDARDLGLALALARASAHPLARALDTALTTEGCDAKRLDQVREVPGSGIEGSLNGQTLRLGRAEWVGDADRRQSRTATWLRIGDRPAVAFTFRDEVRDGAARLIRELSAKGISVMMVSGDTAAPVTQLAEALGIDEWYASVGPAEKAEIVADLTASGRCVLMVGDGLNDTVALAQADVSISPGSALDAARVASDIILLGKDLSVISEAIDVSKRATIRIKENFAVATAYNIVAIPIALLGFATPLMAALAMSLSSISVSLNALRVR